MSSRDLFEEGDTGEAILPLVHNHGIDPTCVETQSNGRLVGACLKVNDRGAHGDRDRSEAPPAGNPLHETRPAEGAGDTVPTEPEYLTADEWAMRMALAWLAGYDPEAYALAMRRGRGDYS